MKSSLVEQCKSLLSGSRCKYNATYIDDGYVIDISVKKVDSDVLDSFYGCVHTEMFDE